MFPRLLPVRLTNISNADSPKLRLLLVVVIVIIIIIIKNYYYYYYYYYYYDYLAV